MAGNENVIPLPGVMRRLCSMCEHAMFGQYGVYCGEFNEYPNDEKVAEECEAFDPIQSAVTVDVRRVRS